MFWFVFAGLLFLFAIYLAGMQHPLISKLDYEIWPYAVGILTGLGGWIVLWRLLPKHAPSWGMLVAVVAPLTLAALVAAWRMWSRGEVVWSYLFGLGPSVAVAYWSAKGGLAGGAATALFYPSLAMIAGLSWYLVAWSHPLGQVGTLDLSEITGSNAPLFEGLFGSTGEQTKRLLEQKGVLEKVARFIWRKHFVRMLHSGPAGLAALVLSCLMWYLSPNQGRMGLLSAPLGALPPLIFWWRSRGLGLIRSALLGPQAALYDFIGVVVPLVFLAGQFAWAWVAFQGK